MISSSSFDPAPAKTSYLDDNEFNLFILSSQQLVPTEPTNSPCPTFPALLPTGIT